MRTAIRAALAFCATAAISRSQAREIFALHHAMKSVSALTIAAPLHVLR
ncbi:MAG: hypothetical protein KF697_06760 [Pseudolabrys sp.]|nr:hypothetical protein [Pseudolabrys sp.]